MGFLKCPRSAWASKLDAHPLSFSLSFHTFIALSASVAWQSLLLALTSIDGNLPSPLISRVNVRLSPFLSSPHNPHHYSIPPIVLCPWLMLMYCVKVEKAWEIIKYETIAWLVIGVVHDESIYVWRKWSMAKLYDFVGMSFLWYAILRRHSCLISMLEVLLFLCQY